MARGQSKQRFLALPNVPQVRGEDSEAEKQLRYIQAWAQAQREDLARARAFIANRALAARSTPPLVEALERDIERAEADARRVAAAVRGVEHGSAVERRSYVRRVLRRRAMGWLGAGIDNAEDRAVVADEIKGVRTELAWLFGRHAEEGLSDGTIESALRAHYNKPGRGNRAPVKLEEALRAVEFQLEILGVDHKRSARRRRVAKR